MYLNYVLTGADIAAIELLLGSAELRHTDLVFRGRKQGAKKTITAVS